MLLIPCLNKLPNKSRQVWSAQGEHRRVWSTLGALKLERSKVSESWEERNLGLSIAFARLSHRLCSAWSIARPREIGASRRVALSTWRGAKLSSGSGVTALFP